VVHVIWIRSDEVLRTHGVSPERTQAETCSICGVTPRLKVMSGRRPWNLCLNEDCPSMEEMRKARAEREAARAAKEAAEAADAEAGGEDKAEAKPKPAPVDTTRTRRRRPKTTART